MFISSLTTTQSKIELQKQTTRAVYLHTSQTSPVYNTDSYFRPDSDQIQELAIP